MNDPHRTAAMISGCLTLLVYGALFFGGLIGAIYLLSHW